MWISCEFEAEVGTVPNRDGPALAFDVETPCCGNRSIDIAIAVLEADMRGDSDPGFLDPRPERIEHRIGGRAQSVTGEDRAVAQSDDPRAACQHPFEFAQREIEVRQRQQRHREDAVLVGKPPFVVDPAVERSDDVERCFDVGLHRAFNAHAVRREHPACRDALRIHRLEPRVAVEPFGMFCRHFRPQVGLVRIGGFLAGKEIEKRAGYRAPVGIAGTGQDRMRLVADEVAQRSVDLDHAQPAILERGIAIAGEGVACLPIVVVGVEDRIEPK